MLLDVLNLAIADDEALCLLDGLAIEVVSTVGTDGFGVNLLNANYWRWIYVLYSPARIAGLYLGCIATLVRSEELLERLRIGEVEGWKLGVLDVHRVKHSELGSISAIHFVDASLDAVGAVGDIGARAADGFLQTIGVDEDVLGPFSRDRLVIHVVVGEVLVGRAIDEGVVLHFPCAVSVLGFAPNLAWTSIGCIGIAAEVVVGRLVGVVECRVIDLDVLDAVGTIVPTDDSLSFGIVVLHDGMGDEERTECPRLGAAVDERNGQVGDVGIYITRQGGSSYYIRSTKETAKYMYKDDPDGLKQFRNDFPMIPLWDIKGYIEYESLDIYTRFKQFFD